MGGSRPTGLGVLSLFLTFAPAIRSDCGPPPKLNNSVPIMETPKESFQAMQSVTYKCLDGFYNIQGKLDVVTCLSSSEWSPIEEFCERSCIRPPRSKFAKIKPGELRNYYPAETKVNYICHPGYDLIPGINSSVTCLENYTWTTLPVFCEGKSCGDPGKPKNGEAVILTNLLFTAKVNFTCEEGYTLIGSPSTECILKGDGVEWETKPPECQRDCPGPPNPPHATLRTGELQVSYPVGTVLRYRCLPGYQMIAGRRPTLECLPNSKWTETPTFCERKRCKPPDIENGRFEAKGDLRLGETITLFCDVGHRLLGEETSRCVLQDDNTVGWNRLPHCERIPCERPPRIPNGMHSGDMSFDHYDYGNVVTYTCNRGFSLIGPASITCTSDDGWNGKWDRAPPECKMVQCDRPSISNGILTTPFQATYKYDHLLYFVCNEGYTLVGSQYVKCGADNLWHPALPRCVKGIFTTVTTTTVVVHPGGDEVPGTPVGPDIRPSSEPTEEAIPNETGSTTSPDGTVPDNKPVSNNWIIITGVITTIILLGAIIFAFMKFIPDRQKRKSSSNLDSPSSYNEVPRNDTTLEMK